MRPLVLVFALVALVRGRPEAGYSYSPPIPSGSYGVPGHGSLGGGLGAGLIHSGASLSHGGGFGVSGLGSAGLTGASFGTSGGASFTSGGAGFGSGAGFVGSSGGAALIQKHIYVHVPPPEPEEFRPHRPIHVAPPQKHYKIIFIKAPTPPTPTAPTIPLQPQNEEKTLVYVLVKKPDEAPEINIPTPAPTQPSKPEVYFIRYKTQKETTSLGGAGAAIAGGASLGGISLGGAGIAGGAGLTSIGGSSIGGGDLSLGGGHGGSVSIGGHSGTVSIGGSHGSSLSTSYGPPGHSGPY